MILVSLLQNVEGEARIMCAHLTAHTHYLCQQSLCYVSYKKSLLFPEECTEEIVGNLSQTIFAITGEDSFLSACFFPTSSLKPFWAIYFPLISVFHRLFGNMTRRCLAQISAPPTKTILPTSLLPAITPSPKPSVTCSKFPRSLSD